MWFEKENCKNFHLHQNNIEKFNFFYCEWVGGDELGCWNVDENF